MNTSIQNMENQMATDMEEVNDNLATNFTSVFSELNSVDSEFTEVHFELDGMVSNFTSLTSNVTGLTSDLTDLQIKLDENLQNISQNFSLLLPNDNGTFCKYLLLFLINAQNFYLLKIHLNFFEISNRVLKFGNVISI